jgi:hypothetical protein
VRLVAECDERAHRLAHRIGRHRRGRRRHRRVAFRLARQLVAHLDHQTLGGLAPDARNLGETRQVFVQHAAGEFLLGQPREHRQRHARTDAIHLEQAAEQASLRLA